MNGTIAAQQAEYKTFLHIFYWKVHLAYVKKVTWMLPRQSC